ncbi:hypothetical protein A2I42_14375 [Salmonella enterica]|nr:hypothetical protein [Salmonella enterica]ECG1719443.1 hypothetical protein [Salmonella enterica subsp. diarizonae serovar 17:z10:e,n,x,z15]ECO1900766.1 hypothetical protein [Salmonella enterica subsp. diarizonae]PTU34463.1 hypothetical protein DBZ43_23060 [Salmonella enterica subsp. enterica]EAS2064702.1 hypothetical protein [Salmonella enterica]
MPSLPPCPPFPPFPPCPPKAPPFPPEPPAPPLPTSTKDFFAPPPVYIADVTSAYVAALNDNSVTDKNDIVNILFIAMPPYLKKYYFHSIHNKKQIILCFSNIINT